MNRKATPNKMLLLLAVILIGIVAVQGYLLLRLSHRGEDRSRPRARIGINESRARPAPWGAAQSRPPGAADQPAPGGGAVTGTKAARNRAGSESNSIAGPYPPRSFWNIPDDFAGWFRDDFFGTDPRDEARRMREEMDNAMSSLEKRFPGPSGFTGGGTAGISASPEITDDGKNYVIRLAIPGQNKADISVMIEGRIMTVSSRSASAVNAKDNPGSSRYERYSSSYSQSLTLPGPVDAAGMKTEFQDGQMTVTVPHASSGTTEEYI